MARRAALSDLTWSAGRIGSTFDEAPLNGLESCRMQSPVSPGYFLLESGPRCII